MKRNFLKLIYTRLMINSNIGCIETNMFYTSHNLLFSISSNIGCIETVLRDKYGDKLTEINSNIERIKTNNRSD